MTATVRRIFPASGDGAWLPAAVLATGLAALLAVPAPAPAATKRSAKLSAFSSCASLVSYAQRNAKRTGGVTGVPTRAGGIVPQVLTSPGPVALDSTGGPVPPMATTSPQASAGTKESTPSFSSTNVQEAGIDEPDIVKTDGRRVFAIVNGKLLALDTTGTAPMLVGSRGSYRAAPESLP